jgi:hypothetical protein
MRKSLFTRIVVTHDTNIAIFPDIKKYLSLLMGLAISELPDTIHFEVNLSSAVQLITGSERAVFICSGMNNLNGSGMYAGAFTQYLSDFNTNIFSVCYSSSPVEHGDSGMLDAYYERDIHGELIIASKNLLGENVLPQTIESLRLAQLIYHLYFLEDENKIEKLFTGPKDRIFEKQKQLA